MVLSLRLSSKPQKEPSLFFARSFPFSFSVSDALKAMKNMSISVDNGSTVTIIKCGIPDNGEYFLDKFLTAKLLHCPGSRTRETIKASVLLQPTAKGFHFVERYCRRNGISNDNVSEMLLSEYNSMQCICLDRHHLTGEIMRSEGIVKLLFQRFMGPSPNTYDASNPPDEIAINNLSRIYGQKVELSLHSPISLIFETGNMDQRVSPYAHRYFTHPDSDSLMQYYVSSKGVRLHQTREFYDKRKSRVSVDFCVSGKAAVQWLSDCTDTIKPSESFALASLFLKYKLLEPITLEPSISGSSDNIVVSRQAYYQLSDRGRRMVFWDRDHFFRHKSQVEQTEEYEEDEFYTPGSSFVMDEDDESDEVSNSKHSSPGRNNNTNTSAITLQMILSDPAMCHLFREYLEENLCQENLLFYKDMEKISDMYKHLKLLKKLPNDKEPIESYSTTILSAIYGVLGRYFSPRAPYGLNIDAQIKRMIIEEMTTNQSLTNDNKNNNNKHETSALVDRMEPLLEKARELAVKMMSQDSLQKFLRSSYYLSAVRSC
ncbi:GTPase-activating protein SST2 [Sugiyamaella lignohabitans]|uniref:GTPase-activating protein SST2 n=1 Tax=Sugiyamaella lignohabitans TaxID=796027 RepID=A0A167F1N5_9ASCO|nr:GTPase-activating protein SST2 [Sugiyamaella lignohabitans]ANB14712.1 GTPase-activating protein SST2 [Sugiyamaella lignohabitans]